MAWISGLGVKYWPGSGLDVLGVTFQQRLVGVALDVGAERQPGLAVDEVLHQPCQHGRFLDFIPSPVEDDPKSAGLTAKRFQGAAVVGLQLVAVTGEQAGPVAAVGDRRRPVVGQQRKRRLAALVHHFEE